MIMILPTAPGKMPFAKTPKSAANKKGPAKKAVAAAKPSIVKKTIAKPSTWPAQRGRIAS